MTSGTDEQAELVLAVLAGIPDVGDTFSHADRSGKVDHYRVTCWLRRRPPRQPHPDPKMEALLQRMAEKYPRRGFGPDQVPLEFCRREQAEYVEGAGVAGVIVRVRDIAVNGRVPWPADLLESERRHANMIAGEPLN